MTTMRRLGVVLACILLAVTFGAGLRAKRDARTAPPPMVTLPPDDPLPEPQAITRECVSFARLVLAKQYHGAEGQSNRLTGVKPLTPGLWQVRGELKSRDGGRVTVYPYECLYSADAISANVHPRVP